MAKYVNVERQIGLKTAFAHLFDHDRFHFFKAMNTERCTDIEALCQHPQWQLVRNS